MTLAQAAIAPTAVIAIPLEMAGVPPEMAHQGIGSTVTVINDTLVM